MVAYTALNAFKFNQPKFALNISHLAKYSLTYQSFDSCLGRTVGLSETEDRQQNQQPTIRVVRERGDKISKSRTVPEILRQLDE